MRSPVNEIDPVRSRFPAARRGDTVDMTHGVRVADPYRWLEESGSAETGRWSAAQDAYWRAVRDHLPDLARWRDRIAEHVDVDFESAPIWRGGTRFVMRHVRGSSHPGLCVTTPDGRTHNLLDLLPDDLKKAASVQSWRPCLDGGVVALTLCPRGSEDGSLLIMDARTGRVVDGPIDGCGHTSIAWRPCGRELFYVRRGSTGARRVYLRRVGSELATDRPVFPPAGAVAGDGAGDGDGDGDGDEAFYSLSASPDGRWLAVSVSDGSAATGNELWLTDLDAGDPARFSRIQPRGVGNSGVTFGPDGLMYVMTNRDAPHWRIMVADPEHPTYPFWRQLVAADAEAVINDFAVLPHADRPRILVSWTRDAISEVSVHDLHVGTRLHDVELPGAGKVGPLVTRDGNGGRAWFSYTDCTTPPRVVEYSTSTGTTTIAADQPPAAESVRTERLWCTSADGTRVQLIVVRPAAATGPAPTVLCGYGGFGASFQPNYSASTMAWVRAGGTWVIANVRGGGERGADWHAAGRGRHKQNTIDDLLACARYLIDNGWTTRTQLAIWGTSNGALLMCAALTQAPELFAAAACVAPLCDMVRYERSGMGPLWRSEYGTAAVADDFRHLLAYSPYHNVESGRAYPATIFSISEQDERVDPWHARKMCAALQHATAGVAPIVLRRERRVGHNNRPMSSAVGMGGDVLAFLAAHTGLRR